MHILWTTWCLDFYFPAEFLIARNQCLWIPRQVSFLVETIPSTTLRRRLRRQRSQARLQLWLHRRGFLHLTQDRLRALLDLLRQHHSAGPAFNKQFIHRYKTLEMANIPERPSKPPSWKCKPCKQVHKFNVEWCPLCWGHWSKCIDRSFTPPQRSTTPTPQKVEWKGQHWYWEPSKEQRAASRSQSRHKEKKTKKEKGGKGQKGQEAEKPFTFAPLSASPFASTGTTYAAAVAAPPPWQNKETVPTQEESPAQADREWIADGQLAAVDGDDKAMTAFDALQMQLKSLHFSKQKHRTAWLSHLATVLEEWQDHVKKYTEQQEEFARQISETTTQMEMIRSSYGELSSKAAANLPKTELVEDPKEEAAGDQAEKAARSKVVSLLHTCSAVAGAAATQVDSDSNEEKETLDSQPRVKRGREGQQGLTPGPGEHGS